LPHFAARRDGPDIGEEVKAVVQLGEHADACDSLATESQSVAGGNASGRNQHGTGHR